MESKITCRYAKSADADWLEAHATGRWSVAERMNALLQIHMWKITEASFLSAIQDNLILVAEDANSRIGYLWFCSSDQCPYGVGYGEWWNPLIWIIDSFVVDSLSAELRASAIDCLYQQIEKEARVRSITEVMGRASIHDSDSHHHFLRHGYVADVIALSKNVDISVKQSADPPNCNWSYRDATATDFDWILTGMLDIFEIEGVLEKANVEEEGAQIVTATNEKRIMVAVDSDGEKLGFLSYAIGSDFPYGVSYGPWHCSYMWISYVWVPQAHRGKGVATHAFNFPTVALQKADPIFCAICRYLYRLIDQRCRELNLSEAWLDVYNVNERSMTVHTKSFSFNPSIQLFTKALQ